MKKYIFTILILLIFFTNAFCQVSDEDTVLSKKNNLIIDEVKENKISFYSVEQAYEFLKNKIKENTNEFLEIKKLHNTLFDGELFIVTFLDNKYYLRCYEARIHNNAVVFYKYLSESYKEKFNEYGLFPYMGTMLYNQITKTELKLFRNLFYAKKGYIFNDEELTKYFKQFPWYKPQSKNISFTDLENTAINRIRIFEADSTSKYEFGNENIIWEVWNGGANERGPLLKLNRDSSFEYTTGQTINRLKKVKGNWSISNNKIILIVESEEAIFGGYDNYDTFQNGTSVKIQYIEPVKITLPINESESYKKYNLNWTDKWLMIGSSDYYISKE